MKEFIYLGPDDFNRPIFKNTDDKTYICSTQVLVGDLPIKGLNKSGIVDYFNNNKDLIVFYGHRKRGEPDGRKLDPTKFKLISK